MRIGLDAMGGDHAPIEEVKGALAAREFLAPGDQIVLIGQEEAILPHLAEAPDWQKFIRIEHCSQRVGMDEAPVEAMRTKPDSSLARMAQMHKRGEVDAIISAGNTGACVAACQMHLRRLEGVHRPGIAIVIPTFHGPVIICDVGANVSCRPQHLLQYGVMATLYARHVAGISNPRVGLLSVGEEDAKGNALVKQTRQLLKTQEGVNFIGNVEGRDIFRGVCDVVISEGFVGNVCLKLLEGLVEGLFKSFAKEFASAEPQLAMQAGSLLKGVRNRYDYNEYGGAPLLGVNGICIICHGSSSYRAIYNAIRVARDFANQGINELITAQLRQCTGIVND